MSPFDHRLSVLADEAKVRPSHVWHVLCALADPAFDPIAFARFARLELRHIEAIVAALRSSGLCPEGSISKRRVRTANGQKGTRLAPVMSIPPEWIAFAQEARRWPLATVEIEFAAFLDYWHAQPGTKGVKLDWQATWRNWCRRSHTPDGSWSPNVGEWTPERAREQTLSTIALYRRLGRDTEADEMQRRLAQPPPRSS